MKSLKIFFLAALVAVAGVFTACTEDSNWSVGKPEKGLRVFFSSENPEGFQATADATSFTVELSRNETLGALEVSVEAAFEFSEDAALFSIPNTILFADGMETTQLTIGYNYAQLTPGMAYDLTLKLVDETLHSAYGYSELPLTIVVPEPYVLLGKAVMREDIVTTFFSFNGDPNPEWEVEAYENTNYPGYIFLKNAYTSAHPANEPGDYVEEDVYFTIDVSDPNNVQIPQQALGNDWGYGAFVTQSIAPGTLNNGVITFPAEGLVIAMLNYNNGQFYYSNVNGMFRVLLPGAVLTDYSMTVAYGGMQVAPDNVTVAAVLNGTFGADVASMRYAFFNDDVSSMAGQAAAMIVAAAEEEVNVMTFEQGLAAEQRVFTVKETQLAAPGSYTIVCVPYDAEGNPQAADVAAAAFYFPGMGGQEIPDCELFCGLFPFSWVFGPDYAAQFPDSSTIAGLVAGVDITSCRYGFITGLNLADLGYDGDVAGQTAVDVQNFVTEALGASSTNDWMYAFEAEDMADINSEQGLAIFFDGLAPETHCMLFVDGKNSYGKSAVYVSGGATTAEGVQAEPMSQKNAAKAGQYVLKTQRTPGKALKAHSLKK